MQELNLSLDEDKYRALGLAADFLAKNFDKLPKRMLPKELQEVYGLLPGVFKDIAERVGKNKV